MLPSDASCKDRATNPAELIQVDRCEQRSAVCTSPEGSRDSVGLNGDEEDLCYESALGSEECPASCREAATEADYWQGAADGECNSSAELQDFFARIPCQNSSSGESLECFVRVMTRAWKFRHST